MKKKDFLLVLIISFSAISSCFAQKDSTHFVTTWKTDNPGLSNDSAIYLEIDSSFTYNFDVDWNNDGVFDTLNVSDNLLIQYPSPGTYSIRIRGVFPATYFEPFPLTPTPSQHDQNKLISINQWGTNPWQMLDGAFKDCKNVTSTATDAPNLTNITSLTAMFNGAASFDADLSNWDVSTITSMYSLFEGATNFNGNVTNWNVSNVRWMNNMFADAVSFNQDVSGWDVSSVYFADLMFAGCSNFNQNISSWVVDSISRMQGMFFSAQQFNQDISSWNIQNVVDMISLFDYSGLSTSNYDKILISWQAKPHQLNVTLGADKIKYCTGDSARTLLIADGWSFNGDSLDCQLVGINESGITPTYKLYPNPARGQVTIETDDNFNVIQIYNSSGQKVLESNSKTTNIEALQSGVYYLQVLFGEKRMSSIFIKE
jgi:surface protein